MGGEASAHNLPAPVSFMLCCLKSPVTLWRGPPVIDKACGCEGVNERSRISVSRWFIGTSLIRKLCRNSKGSAEIKWTLVSKCWEMLKMSTLLILREVIMLLKIWTEEPKLVGLVCSWFGFVENPSWERWKMLNWDGQCMTVPGRWIVWTDRISSTLIFCTGAKHCVAYSLLKAQHFDFSMSTWRESFITS